MSSWQTVLTCEQHHSLDASRALATTKAAARKVDLDDLKLGGLGPGPVAAAIASARLRLKSDCLGCEPPTAPGAPKCVCDVGWHEEGCTQPYCGTKDAKCSGHGQQTNN